MGTRIQRNTPQPAGTSTTSQSESLFNGTNTIARTLIPNLFSAGGSGALVLTAFTAPKSFESNNTVIYTPAPATLVSSGYACLFLVDASENLTLVAQTSGSATPWETAVEATIPWLAPVSIVAGQRYAWGVILNMTGSYYTFFCNDPVSAMTHGGPFLAGYTFPVTTPPAFIPAGTLVFDSPLFYAEIIT